MKKAGIDVNVIPKGKRTGTAAGDERTEAPITRFIPGVGVEITGDRIRPATRPRKGKA